MTTSLTVSQIPQAAFVIADSKNNEGFYLLQKLQSQIRPEILYTFDSTFLWINAQQFWKTQFYKMTFATQYQALNSKAFKQYQFLMFFGRQNYLC